jgi:trimethylamine:corrinoid methyltransferase-like protein
MLQVRSVPREMIITGQYAWLLPLYSNLGLCQADESLRRRATVSEVQTAVRMYANFPAARNSERQVCVAQARGAYVRPCVRTGEL